MGERAGIEAGHGADPVAGEGEDEQPCRVGDASPPARQRSLPALMSPSPNLNPSPSPNPWPEAAAVRSRDNDVHGHAPDRSQSRDHG